MKNKYIAVLLVGLLSGALALGNWKAIWPLFGASNQLIAALVLIVAAVYLLRRNRKITFVAIPAVMMLVTSIGALAYQMYGFITAEEPNITLASIAGVLIVLTVFLSYTAVVNIANLLTGRAARFSEQA